jgi:hypothetical protein
VPAANFSVVRVHENRSDRNLALGRRVVRLFDRDRHPTIIVNHPGRS